MDTLGDLLKQALGKTPNADRKLKQHALWQTWADLVGPLIAARTRPLRVHETTLVIGVSDPSWLQELALMKPTLLEKIHAIMDPDLIRDLRLQLDIRCDTKSP